MQSFLIRATTSPSLLRHPGFQIKRSPLITLSLTEDITELFQRAPDELGILPEVGCEETVAVTDGDEGGLEGVLKGLGRSGRGGVGVLDTGELEETLDSGGGNEASTAGSGDKLEKPCKYPIVHRAAHNRGYGGNRTLTETEPHLPDSLTGRE